jgi:PAS domain S-box-containing protein
VIAVEQIVGELQEAAILFEAASGHIRVWNAAAEALLGYSAAETTSRPIQSFIDRVKGAPAAPGASVAHRKTGEDLLVEMSVSPLANDAGGAAYFLAIVRAAAPGAGCAPQRTRVAGLGADVGRAITSSGSMRDVLGRIARAIIEHLDMATARVWIVNEQEPVLEIQASAGLPMSQPGRHDRIQIGERRIGAIASQRRAQLTNNPMTDADLVDGNWLDREALVAFAGLPLVVEDHAVGVLGMFSRHPIDQSMLDGLAAVLDGVGQYIVRKRAEEALQTNASRFRALIEHSSDMISLHRADGTITYVSPSSAQLVGYEPEALIGRNLLEDVHPDDRSAVATCLREHARAFGAVTTGRYRLRHIDGGWRWIEATTTNLLNEPALGAVVINRRDVTNEVKAHQLLEERVMERTRELVAMLDLARDLASTLELDPLLNLLLDRLQVLLPYTGAGILVVDGDLLYQRAHRSALSDAEGLRVTYPMQGWQEVWRQLEAGEPILITDTHSDSRGAQIWRELVDTPEQLSYRDSIRTCLWAPLVVRDRIVGVLAVTSDDVNAFTPHQAELAAAAARHAAVAIENARLYEAARGTAALQERQRLARELHDSVSQVLYAIALSAAAARQLLSIDTGRALATLDEIHQLSRMGLAEMRALIFELRPESLEHDGLVCALERQAAALEARHGLPVVRELCAEPDVPVLIKEVIYRVAQEALHNAVKHAQGGRLELSLSCVAERIELCIGDDGRGFAPDAEFPGHLGLRSMRERAAVVGGVLNISSAPGQGTRVALCVPIGHEPLS